MPVLSAAGNLTIIAGVTVFLAVTVVLVLILLVAKRYLVHSGKVRIVINNDREVEADSGKPLLSTLADQNIFLPSACGGKGSCGQCKVQVFDGGGDILPTETVHFRATGSGPLAPCLPGEGKGRHEDRGTRLCA